MKLTGDLKSKVDNAKNNEEAKGIIEEAGMLLNDDELEMVSGGVIVVKPETSYDEKK